MIKKYLTLYELNSLVRETIELTLDRQYWVEAELSELREVRGHCYMELVQKDPGLLSKTNTPIARAQARCWHNVWAVVRPHFERVTGQPLRAGLKVLLQVYPQFHEAYGFSWIVTDIDPTFTLGDLARRRQEIVAQLKAEGVFELNKELEMPVFCQRIAVVSAENAAGYGDFVKQLMENEYGFRFSVTLFPAVMQGEQVEQSVIAALDAIAARGATGGEAFDCVVIIRGGGASADLSGFDTLLLAENVANFPIPVVTGIGHDRDESVVDLVAHTHVKTPTAAAALLVSNLKAVLDLIVQSQNGILRYVDRRMQHEHLRLSALTARISPQAISLIRRHEQRLSRLTARLSPLAHDAIRHGTQRLSALADNLSPIVREKLMREQHRLELMEQRVKALDPAVLLQRGYSITVFGGHAVRSAKELHEGDEIETRFAEGRVRSRVSEKR